MRFTIAAVAWLGAAAIALAEPETQTLPGKDPVNSLAFSPDGRYLATAADNRNVRIWDVANASEQGACKIKEGDLAAVAWSPDGRYVIYGGDDKHVRISDARGREIRDIDVSEVTHSIATSSAASLMAIGFKNGTVRLFNTASWTVTKEIEVGSSVESTAFSADGTLLAVGDSNAMVTIYDPQTGRRMKRFAGHSDEVHGLCFNKGGTVLASGCFDHTIRLWDPSSGKAVRTLMGHSDQVRCVAFSPDGTKLASCAGDGTVRIWDPSSGEEKDCWETGQKGRVSCVAWSPDGKILASAGADGRVTLWYLEKKVAPPEPPKPEPPKPEPPRPEPPKPDPKQITRERIEAISSALKSFEGEHGYLPHSVNSGMVVALSSGRRGGTYRFDKAELNASNEVIDAWGRPLAYRSPGTKGASFDLYSFGPNGKDDCGTDDDVWGR